MVRARHPEGLATHHAVHAYNNVLQRIVQSMTQMQSPSNIGRWDYNTNTFSLLVHIRMATLIIFPDFRNTRSL